MYDAFKNPGGEQPPLQSTVRKRSKPSIWDILLAATDRARAFDSGILKEKTKADSIPGDTWYMK